MLFRSFFSDPTVELKEEYLIDLIDHFNMLDQIRKFDPNIRMRCKNHIEFRTEHQELSKIISTIKKGWSIEYKFDSKMVDNYTKMLESHFLSQDLVLLSLKKVVAYKPFKQMLLSSPVLQNKLIGA